MLSFRSYMKNNDPILAELAHFNEFINKKGNDFLEGLLNRRVTVNLKIDQSAFVVGNDSGEIKYFGREGKVQITPFRRQGADLYEGVIKHIETRKLNEIPNGVYVYLEFFDDRLPTLIKYTQKPKNNMIISYVKRDGKIVPPAEPINGQMADLLAVSPPPVLFDGKLSSHQKKKLIEYVSTAPEDLSSKYGGKNFVQYVLSLFVVPSKMKYLMTDNLEGMVFYFDDGKQVDLAKINDPSFTQGIKDKGNKDDQYHKMMMEAIYDKLSAHADRVLAKKPSNYTDFIYLLTNQFLRDVAIKKLNKYQSQVTAKRFARLTFSMLPRKVESMVNKTWYAEDIFRILHFMLEKPKRRANPRTGLTKERKEMVNSVIAKIKNINGTN